jgi:Domain of unknown function (DUF4342)
MSEPQDASRWEEISVTSDRLVATIRDLVREGNVRRIVIKNRSGRVYLEIPLTVGVIGAMLMPMLAAIAAIAAVAGGFTVAVEKIVRPGEETPGTGTPPAPESPTDPTGDDGPEN